MNTRRKFLQGITLLSTTSLIAKNAFSIEKGLATFENKFLGGSLRKLSVLYSNKNATHNYHTILISTKKNEEENVENGQLYTYNKGLVKTGVLYYNSPSIQNGQITKSFIEAVSSEAKSLKSNGYQIVMVYVNANMPEPKNIVCKDYWVAQCHSIDVIFTNGNKQKTHTRICQDKNKQELIIATMNPHHAKEVSMDFLFDIGLQKKGVMIA